MTTKTCDHHCWHETGVAYLTYPEIIEIRCCWCGATGQKGPKAAITLDHGPFRPDAPKHAVGRHPWKPAPDDIATFPPTSGK